MFLIEVFEVLPRDSPSTKLPHNVSLRSTTTPTTNNNYNNYNNNNYQIRTTMSTLPNQPKRRRSDSNDDDQSQEDLPFTQEAEVLPTTTTQPPPPPAIRTQGPNGPSPSAIAREIVSVSIESLPDNIKSFILPLYTKHHRLKTQETHQAATTARFAVEDFIPLSARIKFTLTGSERAMESDLFRAQQEAVQEKIKSFQLELKTAMQSTILIETNMIQDKITANFLVVLNNLSSLFFIERHPTTVADAVPSHAISRYVLSQQNAALYEHLPLSANNVRAKYRDYAQDDVTTIIAPPANYLVTFQAINQRLTPILKSIFLDSWNTMLKEQAERERTLALAKQIRRYTVGPATEDAAMVIDTQPTADPQLMKDLIKAEVARQTKKKMAQLDKVIQKNRRSGNDPSKNTNRGASQSRGASATNGKKTPAQIKADQKKKQQQKKTSQSRNAGAARTATVTFAASQKRQSSSRKKKQGASARHTNRRSQE